MENKQTAVDYLVTIVQSCIAPNFIPVEIIEQAKQMEKEQIKDAFKYGEMPVLFINFNAEDYYNKTYKQQENEKNN